MDAWLGGPGLGRIVSPRTTLDVNTTVDFFIYAYSKLWDKHLLREHFLPFEVERILSTPIRMGDVKDEICWVYGGDGALLFVLLGSRPFMTENLEIASSSKSLCFYLPGLLGYYPSWLESFF